MDNKLAYSPNEIQSAHRAAYQDIQGLSWPDLRPGASLYHHLGGNTPDHLSAEKERVELKKNMDGSLHPRCVGNDTGPIPTARVWDYLVEVGT